MQQKRNSKAQTKVDKKTGVDKGKGKKNPNPTEFVLQVHKRA